MEKAIQPKLEERPGAPQARAGEREARAEELGRRDDERPAAGLARTGLHIKPNCIEQPAEPKPDAPCPCSIICAARVSREGPLDLADAWSRRVRKFMRRHSGREKARSYAAGARRFIVNGATA
jgi:hypothetical protein